MGTARTRPTKSQQLNFRTTHRQADLLRRAAAAADTTVTDFVLDSAVERAERVLADQRLFGIDKAQWDEFVALLDAPLPSTERFHALKSRPDPFVDGP
ncbi:DUF1778 domain-containing protein [Nostocoides veronense]|uniref:DUF1778 domain-containing protein n=1 Tax=Nostocoides veronense TaxID=330836 RepID=A0ABP4Y0F1_9MICO